MKNVTAKSFNPTVMCICKWESKVVKIIQGNVESIPKMINSNSFIDPWI